VRRLMDDFGATLAKLAADGHKVEAILPVVDSVRDLVGEHLKSWVVQPHLVAGDDDKYSAFKLAKVALAASGTVTLELALAGTPMVVAYKVDAVAAKFRFLVKTPSIVLANLVHGTNAFPEHIQETCTPDTLAAALVPLLSETPARTAQLTALSEIPQKLLLSAGQSPSQAAANIVLRYAEGGRGG
jgi:lipid-A-disaccharide synthase